jgi:lysophospholipase L1-like esterase
MSWVKLSITAATANEIDELELWDATDTASDSYACHGDSISVRTSNLRGTNPNYGEQPSFQADIQTSLFLHYPLQVGGGIVGEGSGNAASEIAGYLAAFPDVTYWVNTEGTNDRCGMVDSTIQSNLTSWANTVTAAGRTPILSHPVWGNNVAAYCSNNGPAYNADVDAVVANLNLLPAIDLYGATYNHSEYFDTNDVHPNSTGCAAINQAFAAYATAHLY